MQKVILCLFLFIYSTVADANEACLDKGSHSDDWWFVPELEWWEITIGSIFIFSTLCVLGPQILKIVKRRSSKGVSPEYVLLVTCNSLCGFTNATIFNYPYMQSCPYVGYDICIPALLSWIHMIVMMSLEITNFTLVVLFHEEKRSKRFKIVVGYYCFYLIGLSYTITITMISIFVIGIVLLFHKHMQDFVEYVCQLLYLLKYFLNIIQHIKINQVDHCHC